MQKTKAILVISIISLALIASLYSINGAKAVGSGVDWWNSYGHNLDNNRVSTSKGPRSSQLLWTYTVSAQVRSSAAVVDGVVYCAGFDGTVFAINANMGIQIWKVKIGDKVWASPTVVNGRVYVGNMENVFYSLNAYTGETVWTYLTASGMFNGPAVSGGVVYQASNEGTIHALDETTGALKWSFKANGEVRCTPSVVDGVVYLGSTGATSGTVYALRATDGSKLWSFPTGPGLSSFQDSSPAVAGGIVFIGSSDGNLYALDALNGAKKWSFNTSGKVSSSPAVFQGVIYVGSEDGKVYALSDSTGAKIWEYTVGSPVYSSPSVADGAAYIGAYGSSKVLALDTSNGALIWSYNVGSVFASPAIANGVVYIGSYDSKMYAFGAPDGRAWGTDFNYKDLDEMRYEGWTVLRPTGTTLVPGNGVILDGNGGATEIGYIEDIPLDIFDWKIDVKGMWLGGTGHSGINVKMVTEKHTYIWAVDGAIGQYVFYRDGSKTLGVEGYVEKINENVYLTIEKNGSIVSLYSNGKFIKNFLESDTLPSRVTGVTLSSPSGSKNQYTYVGAFVPEAKAEPTPPTEYTLTVTATGSGLVSKSPDKATYTEGESVQLIATAVSDYSFTGWSGDLSGSTNPISIILNANKVVIAAFTQNQSTTIPAVFAGGVTNGTAVASSKVTVSYQNPSTKTSYYEVKVDGEAWINNGLTTTYTFTGLSLGEHTFEVRAVDSTGVTLSSSNLNIYVSVWVPPVINAVSSSVVTVSVISIVSIIATAVSTPSSLPLSWLWQKIDSLLPEGVKGWLESFVASKRQLVIEQKTGSIFILTKLEIFAYASALVVMTFAFAYAGAGSLDQLILLIPTVLATSVVVGIAKNLITEVYARMNGVWAEHHLWYFGLATFLLSTIAFKTPFSSPSRVVHHSPKFNERSQGLVASASVVISLVFAGIFYALLIAGFSYIGSLGLAMCLLGALFDTIPVAPMNGKDIFNWSKPIWVAQFLIVVTLYISWLLLL
jgi:outer membrane protein assembly factor BamB